MKKVKIGSYDVELYDSIDELPVVRFHKYNKMLLVDAGIGSDLSDFDSHIERAIRFCRTKPELAAAELDNLRQNVYFIQSGISPKHLAFCVMVTKIDGKEVDDITDEGLKKTLEILGDVKNSEMTAQLEAVKKKIDEELNLYFPKIFDDAGVKEYYDQLRKRTIVMLDAIIEGHDRQREVEEITNLLMTFAKPMSFSGAESMEIQYDKQFESMCLMLSQKLNVKPKEFTVLEYYNSFEFIKEQMKKSKKKAS